MTRSPWALRRLRPSGNRRASEIDVLLAAAAFAALLIDPVIQGHAQQVTPWAGVLALAAAIPLTARRRSPLGALAAVIPLLIGCLAVFHPNRAAVGVVMLLVFTVGLQGDRARSLVVGASMAPVVAVAVLLTARTVTPVDFVAYTALVLGALAAGEAVRARQALQQEMLEEADRERVAQAQHRFDEERLLLAHELHDFIGHALVAINVRAAAAAHLERRRDMTAAPTILDEIAVTSAEALSELRTTLKALRARPTGAAPVPLHPAQDFDNLTDLVAGVEGTGLSVTLETTELKGLPATISHTGYRIVQEGLTNAMRHSTATQAHVCIRSDAGIIVVEVSDNGRAKTIASPTDGHGLAGMKERAAALGGTCDAGPTPGGGWQVQARLPLHQATVS